MYMPLFDMTSFANVCISVKSNLLLTHGCFKVCDTLKIIEDVGFQVFKALKDDITCVSNGTSFFNSPNNSSTVQWEQGTIH